MKRTIKALFSILTATAILSGCVKKIDPIDSYGVTVNFNSNDPKAVIGDKELNPKDSFVLDFSLTSAKEDIAVIEIQRNGARLDTFSLANRTDRRSFSGQKRYRIDSAAGDYSYRVLARNSRGVFLGDGGKLIRLSVKSDFYYWTYRFMSVPNPATKASESFFSTSEGKTYSFNTGAANSAKIDFGFFYDTTTVGVSVANQPKNTIYAPASDSFYKAYNLTGWTKNATVFRRVTTPTFTNMTSAAIIRSAGMSNLTGANAAPRITILASGNVILFRTAAGKYGAVNINYIESTSDSVKSYMNVDVKVEK